MIIHEVVTVSDAEKFIEDNIPKIGKIKYVKQTKIPKKVEYVTTFVGENDTIELSGGITSGYVGTSPGGFVRILVSLGLEEQKAKDIVHKYNDEENRELIIEF